MVEKEKTKKQKNYEAYVSLRKSMGFEVENEIKSPTLNSIQKDKEKKDKEKKRKIKNQKQSERYYKQQDEFYLLLLKLFFLLVILGALVKFFEWIRNLF